MQSASQKHHTKITVESVLDRKGHQVWFVGPTVTAFEAVKVMSEKNVGVLLVMERGDLLGVVSVRDCARDAILRARLAHKTTVREIMSTALVTIDPLSTIEEAMNRMNRFRARHLPVMRDDKVVGVISIGDIVDRLASDVAENR